MNAPVVIKGWCPTALRPMMSGDGLLLRVPVQNATLDAADALAIAELSRTYGNGLIDLTQRANLQLRGVLPEHISAVVTALCDRGLVERESGDVPVNIICDPLAGLDPDASDVRPLSQAVERGLRTAPAFTALPSKFGFSLDGAGRFPLGETGADVRLVVQADSRVAIGTAGAPEAAVVEFGFASEAALQLAHAFLHLRSNERRMHALVARLGADAILAKAGLVTGVRLSAMSASPNLLGLFVCGPMTLLGVAAPFGAWHANDLSAVARRVAADPGATIRVAPGRVLLLAGLPEDEAHRACADFASRALIVSADDTRLRVAACAGAPACSSGQAPTRDLAAELARLLPNGEGIALHVSGCAKGCAHPAAAPLTLVGHAGAYDLVDRGGANDAPAFEYLASADAARAVRERQWA